MSDPQTPPLPTRIEGEVIAALDLDEAPREAMLASLCARHSDHADAIRRLVAAVAERSEVDTLSLVEAFRRIRDERGIVGTAIAGYRIVQQLGSGAHGDVYLAEQQQPLTRRVAIKVLRERAAGSDVLARFEAERQALALFDHAAIAKLFEAGSTDDGRPWFAMELVPSARSIVAFCREERIPLAGRLQLFAKVCDAVLHAHARGILHRDLKPGNVLCASVDGQPAPKVIDFGIAKAMGGRLTERPFHTIAGRPIGTPVYASPEQARGTADIDVRTDVYSLGALLHELCCGEYAFAEHDLARTWTTDRAKFFDIVTNRDPQLPSQRLQQRSESGGFVEDDHELAAKCRGDLDAIVGKALSRAREQRYQTVAELAADVQHVIAGEPVAARLPNLIARARRVARRNRVALVAGGVVTAVLAIALALIGAAYSKVADTKSELEQTNRDLKAANANLQAREREALEHARELKESTDRLSNQVLEADSVRLAMRHAAASLPGPDATLRQWAELLIAPIERDAVATPEVASAMRRTVAWILVGLGDKQRARDLLAASLPALTGDDEATRLERAATAHALGDAVLDVVPAGKGIDYLQQAVTIYRDLLGDDAPETMAAAGDLAFLQILSRDARVSWQGFEDMIAIGKRIVLAADDPLRDRSARELLDEAMKWLLPRLRRGEHEQVRSKVDEFVAPALAIPRLRARLCNILTATAAYPQIQHAPQLRVLLLEAAVDYGVREHGHGHDHVVEARSMLLSHLLAAIRGKSRPDATLVATALAHGVKLQRIEQVKPWPFGELPCTGLAAVQQAMAAARRGGLLPDRRDELLRLATAAGILDDDDLAALRERLER